MQTTTRNDQMRRFLTTMLLGLVMAVVIALVAEPEVSSIGFVLAAMSRHGGARRTCLRRAGGAAGRS